MNRSGWLLTRLWAEVSAGMILEVPRYQWPSLRTMVQKVWLRLRDFILVSWPLLIGGSAVLSLAEFLRRTANHRAAIVIPNDEQRWIS